ncbi:uncharacterized protein LAJ45_09738 [Morchella importuna]|uniref:uncharacterized protein n=1 Tax=Morchella importuna TaxID=1174673 RepID=UPI001E8CE7AD|nr:uncharacterized protein LAJ45_09738 [Morchella importuna]KAH8146295.1 hypothetical protein LAJ45_09738 [Morchella importuna]
MLLLVDFPEDGRRKARCTGELEYSRGRYGAPVSISSKAVLISYSLYLLYLASYLLVLNPKPPTALPSIPL